MFEFDQDFALDLSAYSHEAQQTRNRATMKVNHKNREFRVLLGRGARGPTVA